MKLLLDTHYVIWWLADDNRISRTLRAAIADRGNTIYVSVVSLWEIAIKVRRGKLALDIAKLERSIDAAGFVRLPIASSHLAALLDLPVAAHSDPFDHLLIAQAISEAAVLASVDRIFSAYPVTLLT